VSYDNLFCVSRGKTFVIVSHAKTRTTLAKVVREHLPYFLMELQSLPIDWHTTSVEDLRAHEDVLAPVLVHYTRLQHAQLTGRGEGREQVLGRLRSRTRDLKPA